ncbi:hypothetical protein GOP47_0014323 [Adiantum capillus-veneris]|uniref:Uncharacterized protein n=1 Tax=Adiantum capillus-veneris TaxID=13818 RepID=A0A9D4ULE7_ADICA|nr:hypothetical protein GOP47_0014323 [Adiantum capillus-veneris]
MEMGLAVDMHQIRRRRTHQVRRAKGSESRCCVDRGAPQRKRLLLFFRMLLCSKGRHFYCFAVFHLGAVHGLKGGHSSKVLRVHSHPRHTPSNHNVSTPWHVHNYGCRRATRCEFLRDAACEMLITQIESAKDKRFKNHGGSNIQIMKAKISDAKGEPSSVSKHLRDLQINVCLRDF